MRLVPDSSGQSHITFIVAARDTYGAIVGGWHSDKPTVEQAVQYPLRSGAPAGWVRFIVFDATGSTRPQYFRKVEERRSGEDRREA